MFCLFIFFCFVFLSHSHIQFQKFTNSQLNTYKFRCIEGKWKVCLWYPLVKSVVFSCGICVDVEFKQGDREHLVEVEVLYDGVREMREAFTVHLKPDENMVAEIQVGRENASSTYGFISESFGTSL